MTMISNSFDLSYWQITSETLKDRSKVAHAFEIKNFSLYSLCRRNWCVPEYDICNLEIYKTFVVQFNDLRLHRKILYTQPSSIWNAHIVEYYNNSKTTSAWRVVKKAVAGDYNTPAAKNSYPFTFFTIVASVNIILCTATHEHYFNDFLITAKRRLGNLLCW